MVLGSQGPGRVGRRRFFHKRAAFGGGPSSFWPCSPCPWSFVGDRSWLVGSRQSPLTHNVADVLHQDRARILPGGPERPGDSPARRSCAQRRADRRPRVGGDVLVLRTVGRRSGRVRDAPCCSCPGRGLRRGRLQWRRQAHTRVVVQPAGSSRRRGVRARAHPPGPRAPASEQEVAELWPRPWSSTAATALQVDRDARVARRDTRAALRLISARGTGHAGDRRKANVWRHSCSEQRLPPIGQKQHLRRRRRLAPPPRCVGSPSGARCACTQMGS